MPPPFGSSPNCSCKARYHAMAQGEFLWSDMAGGWVFVDLPTRNVNWRTRYIAGEQGRVIEDHTGEPYTWHDCPFCGFELPHRIKPTLWIEDDGN